MTVGPRASTERKEDQREVRGKMTLTVECSEMTAKTVEHFKITATTSANWGIPARPQEEYKQKKISRHTRMLIHTRSDTFAPWATWQLARTHTSTLLTRVGKKKKIQFMDYAWRKGKNQCKTSFYLKRVREVPVKPKVKVSEGNRCSNYSGRVRPLSRWVHLTWLSTPSRKCWVTDLE